MMECIKHSKTADFMTALSQKERGHGAITFS